MKGDTMEFIQKKTADSAIEAFLSKAADRETSLVWDRLEGQLPECGFCETGLSCRDCLQGPCISHPFRESNKTGVCGKDKDILASQALLRLVMKGAMAILDQVSTFKEGIESGGIKPKKKTETDLILKETEALLSKGGSGVKKDFPKALIRLWEEMGVSPGGLNRDLLKASGKLEGGMAGADEILLWAFRVSLLACLAQRLHGKLKTSVFGDSAPTKVEVNLGILKKEAPNILLCGYFSPVLKYKIVEAAKKTKVTVSGVCTDPLLPPYSLGMATNYGSQEIPLMTGAVDLIVAGDQFVNPSLAAIAKEWEIPIVPAGGLSPQQKPDAMAKEIVEKAKKSFQFRKALSRDIPENKESAQLGFSPDDLNLKKILDALAKKRFQGIAIFSGSGNVKFTQDREIATIVEDFLKKDILCLSGGEASIALAKYGFLNPDKNGKEIGKGLSELLPSLGKNIPAVIDLGSSENGGVIDFLLSTAEVGKKDPGDYPVFACFAEANRSSEVAEAMALVAMGIPVYFWPALPITGSPKTLETLSQLCGERFGARLHIPMDKKMEARAKASLMIKDLGAEPGHRLSGHAWKK
jgi:carbon-monoxide dehydrogenase catalytic subunit